MKYGRMQPKVIGDFSLVNKILLNWGKSKYEPHPLIGASLNLYTRIPIYLPEVKSVSTTSTIITCFLFPGRERRWFSINEAWDQLSHRPCQQSYLCDVMRSKWKTDRFTPSFAVCIDSQSKTTNDLEESSYKSVWCRILNDISHTQCKQMYIYTIVGCCYFRATFL